MRELLPVVHRIKFKMALLLYMAHSRLCPLYISKVLTAVSSAHRRSQGVHWVHVNPPPKADTKLGVIYSGKL